MPQALPLLLFVVNPISGGKTKEGWENAIREYFKEKPYKTEFFILDGKNDQISLQHYIKTLQPDKLIAVGGDGTVKMVAEQIANKNIPLGILPAGSANGMAKELQIPDNLEDALDILIKGEFRAIDVININGNHHCLHLSDIGLNARLIKYYEQHPKRGMMSYGRFIFKALWRKRLLKTTIKTESGDIYREAFMIVLANARMYGTGAVINPEGNLGDGFFEIVILKKLSVIELLKMILKLNSFNSAKTEILKTKEIIIETEKAAHFQIDGEYMGKTKRISANILPSYIQIIVPKTNNS